MKNKARMFLSVFALGFAMTTSVSASIGFDDVAGDKKLYGNASGTKFCCKDTSTTSCGAADCK